MITVLLVNMCAEVKVLKYDTTSDNDAARRLIEDWKAGNIRWDYDDCNAAFTPDWLEKYGMEPLGEDYTPLHDNGVRIIEWRCCMGTNDADDQIVCGYLVPSYEESGQQEPPAYP